MDHKTLKRVIVLISLTFMGLSANAQETQRWTPENLTGIVPGYSGPSCYTAAMLAKGYVKSISFVGAHAIKFYTGNFCEKRKGPMQAGDLLVLTDKKDESKSPFFDHVAIYLGEGKVFEKESGDGLFQPVYPEHNPAFQTKRMSESYWFKNYEGDNRNLTAYQCADSKTVQAKLSVCEARANQLGVDKIQRAFEKTVFMKPPAFALDEEVLKATVALAQFMRNVPESDPCFDYFVVTADSIDYDFKSIRLAIIPTLPNAKEVERAKEELMSAMFPRFAAYQR